MAVLALFVAAPWIVFTGIAKVKAAGGSSGGTQLRRSDLEALIEVAVEDATEPLRRRIEALEAIAVDEDARQDRIDAALLADALDEVDAERPTLRRRARE